MSSLPRESTIETTRWPVLARLPDVSAESLAQRPMKQTAPGGPAYRFDPPQNREAGVRDSNAPQMAVRPQPHAFDRARTGGRVAPRRESPILPRSNPFTIPGPRLIESLAPAVRFLTMVALFTAAGTWIQMKGHRTPAATQKTAPPRTATQPSIAPAKSAADHSVPAPTATGPLNAAPQTGARVGQIEGHDFARHEAQTVPLQLNNRPVLSPPHFLVRGDGPLPRVRNSEPLPAEVANDPAEGAPSVAHLPGFVIETPTR